MRRARRTKPVRLSDDQRRAAAVPDAIGVGREEPEGLPAITLDSVGYS
jgi:hypothetical protein